MKIIETHARAFLPLNISAISSVKCDQLAVVGNWLIVYNITGQITVSGITISILSYSTDTVRLSVDAAEMINNTGLIESYRNYIPYHHTSDKISGKPPS